MIHLKGETYTTDSSGKMQNRSISGVQIQVIRDMTNYTEAPFLSKHDNLYYLTYASGLRESISYEPARRRRGRGNTGASSWTKCRTAPAHRE